MYRILVWFDSGVRSVFDMEKKDYEAWGKFWGGLKPKAFEVHFLGFCPDA